MRNPTTPKSSLPGSSPSLLSSQKIHKALNLQTESLLSSIEIHEQLASTNQYLLASESQNSGQICLAESQSAGRGRRNKLWFSPPYENIYLSVTWRFATNIMALSGLSLGVGIVTAQALQPFVVGKIGIKWPNDLYILGNKLGGILIEVKYARQDSVLLVIGIGINCQMQSASLDQAWTSLQLHSNPQIPLDRNDVTAAILNAVLPYLDCYCEQGDQLVQTLWPEFDITLGQEVSIYSEGKHHYGIASGIDSQYRFRLQTHQKTRTFSAADVSLRVSSSG